MTTITILIIIIVMITPSQLVFFRMAKLAQAAEQLAFGDDKSATFDARHVGILMVARAMPTLSQQAIGGWLSIDRTTMVRLTDELEAAGYVTRSRREEDRRSMQLALTRKGTALVLIYDERLRESENRLLSVLTEHERASLERSTAKLFRAWVLKEPSNKENE